MNINSLPPSDRDETPEPAASSQQPAAAPIDLTLRERFAKHLKDTGLSQNRAGTKLGVSGTMVTQYLNGKYGGEHPGDVMKLERKLTDYLDNEARRRQAGVETVECEQTVEVRTALELIRRTNDVGVVLAESGDGKTRGIEHYRQNNPTCILYHVRSWTCDKASIEGALLDAAGREGWDKQTKIAPWLVRKLGGSDRLLIFDDAHKLTRPALQWVFDFHDATGVPVALIGTFGLEDKLADDPQRFRRVGYRHELKPENPAALIAHLVKTLAPGASPAEARTLETLCAQVAEKRGHFGDVHKQLKLAAEIKSASPSLSWEKCFRAAHKKLFRDYALN